MEFTALCPSNNFKVVSSLYFTKNLHCEIVNELIGSNIIFNKEPIQTSQGEIYVMEPDFHLISTKTEISIYWYNLDYKRIKEYNDKIVNYLGLSKYYWDVYERESGEFLAECRSGVFELDGEISISNPANRKYDNITDSLPEDNDDYNNDCDEECDEECDNNDEKEKEKEMPLEKMCDIDIIRFIEKLGREPRDECDLWKFTYDPNSPYFIRFSYGTFNNCTIPRRTMCFTKEFPLVIRGAKFTNVDFGLCVFCHVLFLDCAFVNCDFSKSIIQHLTFETCQINNTNIKYDNVFVEDLELEDM